MSTKLKRLQDEALATVKQAKDLVATAEAASREMTDGEKADYSVAMTRSAALLQQMKTAKADEDVLEQAAAFAKGIGSDALADLKAQAEAGTPAQRLKNLGLDVVSSAQFKAAMGPYKGRAPGENSPFRMDPVTVKSLFIGGSDTSAGAFVTNEDSGIVEMLGRRTLTLRDLVSVRRTTSDAVDFVRQTSHTNAAAPVAEATSSAEPTADADGGALVRDPNGGYKPEGSWTFERDTANVKTIAEWVPATKRSLADVAALEGLINDELRADVAEAEEDQMLGGDGTGENLLGILQTSGLQTQAFTTDIFTSIRKGITKVRTGGRAIATGILLSPEDAELVDLARENGTTGSFIAGGPFAAGQRTIWGKPYVESEAIATGTSLVGDYSKAVLWDREETTISITDSHSDFFIRNLVAILAEERVAFAVTRPAAFVKVATKA